MPKNEFGVESSSSGGFGAGVGDDFEDMFEQAINASVVDDEVSTGRRSQPAPKPVPVSEPDYFDSPPIRNEEPVAEEPRVEAPIITAEPSYEPEPSFEDTPSYGEPVAYEDVHQGYAAPEANEEPSFGAPNDLESMFDEAEGFSVADDELREPEAPAQVDQFEDSFDSFGAEPEPTPLFNSFSEPTAPVEEPQSFEPTTQWGQPAAFEPEQPQPELSFEPTAEVEPEAPVIHESAPVAAPEPETEAVYYEPTVAEPTPSVVPESSPAPVAAPQRTEADVDYIERVILTSDAIRELPQDDAKAVNMFITAGQPVESHQELVLTALHADRQIYSTTEAILEAKSKSSVDRAFHILGLDDATFVDFGKILSHDLESTETVLFEGDRLQYARKLVDVVESLPEVSIKRFEAVKSVLGAGELDS